MLAQILAYTFLLVAMIKPNDDVGIPCATAACLLYMFAKTIGEATIVGFMKALP